MQDGFPAAARASVSTSIPSGTVAFLFTDIEGSTNRWEHHHDAMAAALGRHNAILRAAIERHGGFVFKTVGDAFCAAFHAPLPALDAAIDAQRQLIGEDFSAVGDLRVRMGIHVGTAVERDRDYFGPTVNRVARLMSIGHGGQVLVSEDVRNALARRAASDLVLVDLGLRRLKDLMHPEHVWQVSVSGLPHEFAPLTSLDARPNNLPVQLTALLGREVELDAVKQMIAAHQLVTIAGAGGVGKTRLALQLGADLIDRFEHGVWFVDLAPLSEARLVASAVAQAVEVKQSGESLDASILDALKRRDLLLIVDNCEHVLDGIAPLVDAILKQCPQVRIVTTSRQPLAIAGEFVHRLPSLAVPDPSQSTSAVAARGYGAVALFVERATAADSRFALTDDAAPVVAEICRRLDGIPLAIELAAARVKVLSIPALSKRLDERFKILTAGNRTALPRQKTLVALIDWSYGLLEPGEQIFFDRVGIFSGGFTFEAACDVCSGAGVDEADVLDLLSSLTDKSLVLADTAGAGERYRLLESTRAYALEKLEAGGARSALERRHAEYFRRFARRAHERHRSEATEAWMPEEELEVDNFRSALGWALRAGHDPLLGADIVGALGPLWIGVGLSAEGREWISMAVDAIDAQAQPQVAARAQLAFSSIVSGERSRDMAVRALEGFKRCGDEAGEADAHYSIAWQSAEAMRKDEADAAIDRAISIYTQSGPRLALARALAMKGIVAERREEFDASRSFHREAIAMLRALGCERMVGAALTNLGATELLTGNYHEAQRCFDEALAVFLPRKNDRDLTIIYNDIAINRFFLDDIVGAREAARGALQHARAMHDTMYVADAVFDLAYVGARSGRFDDAARLFGYCRHQFEAHGLTDKVEVYQPAQLLAPLLEEHLSPDEIRRLKNEGAQWPEDRALATALTL